MSDAFASMDLLYLKCDVCDEIPMGSMCTCGDRLCVYCLGRHTKDCKGRSEEVYVFTDVCCEHVLHGAPAAGNLHDKVVCRECTSDEATDAPQTSVLFERVKKSYLGGMLTLVYNLYRGVATEKDVLKKSMVKLRKDYDQLSKEFTESEIRERSELDGLESAYQGMAAHLDAVEKERDVLLRENEGLRKKLQVLQEKQANETTYDHLPAVPSQSTPAQFSTTGKNLEREQDLSFKYSLSSCVRRASLQHPNSLDLIYTTASREYVLNNHTTKGVPRFGS